VFDEPEDQIRRYVYIDGHIGVEPLDDIYERFARAFTVLEAYPWLVRPFVAASNAIEAWPDYVIALRSVDTSEARDFHDMAAHRYNRFFRQLLRDAIGPVQTSSRIREIIVEERMRTMLSSLVKDTGFSFISVERS
jgi:hypothetical protein